MLLVWVSWRGRNAAMLTQRGSRVMEVQNHPARFMHFGCAKPRHDEEAAPMNRHSIQQLREAQGESQESLPAVIGVPSETVVDWETGKSEPTVERLRRLIDHFGIKEHELDLRPGHPRSVFERIEDLL